jgi:hypothetical protein
MRRMIALWLVLAGCHHLRGDDKPLSAGDYCKECCQQQSDACKLDSDHPGYYCPRQQQECVTACAESNENEMCVVQTNRKYAATAPKPVVATAAPAAQSPPVAAVHRPAEVQRGECDNRGTWNLKIGDAKGHAVGCAGLGQVPRDVSFRIERQKDVYALRDLIPAPGWQDGFAIESHEDVCVVTLTRDNKLDGERPKLMTVQLTEKDGNVQGTFHYIEQMKQPIDCRLDAMVTGLVEAPAPRPAPPQQLPPQQLPPPIAPKPPVAGSHSIGAGQELQPTQPGRQR